MRDVDKEYSELKNIEKGPKKYISRHKKKRKQKSSLRWNGMGGMSQTKQVQINTYIHI